MHMPQPVVATDLEGLRLANRGKVRDIYELGPDLLIVATDRISCFDVVLRTPIPWKGRVLTYLTAFWLEFLKDLVPNHLITADVDAMGAAVAPHRDLLRGRAMLVRRAQVLPVECVVRGYLSGSGWRSYQKTGEVCGVRLPAGLVESDKLPEPIFTPTTKAAAGHDLPMSAAEVEREIGPAMARRIRDLSVEVYRRAADYAAERGVIIADTKFEWGLCGDERFDDLTAPISIEGLTLVDEVLTPDSSRFWPGDAYRPGGPQPSFDKQYVRDWLDSTGWNHEPPSPELPEDVVRRTAEKYLEACRLLTGGTPSE